MSSVIVWDFQILMTQITQAHLEWMDMTLCVQEAMADLMALARYRMDSRLMSDGMWVG